MQGEDTEKRGRRSTRHYVVDDRRAEILASQFEGVFSAADIREALEGEPVAKALGLLEWASKKRLPMKALRNKAKKDGLGYYRPKGERPDPAEEYRRYLAFVRRKEEESRERRGRSLARGAGRPRARVLRPFASRPDGADPCSCVGRDP